MMKRCFVFLLLLALRGYPITDATQTALLNEARILLKGMGEHYFLEAFPELASVAVSFLRDLLTDGVFNSFGNSNGITFKDIFNSLQNIIKLQNQILTEIQKLSSKLSSIVTEFIIADDDRKIKGCVDSYELLLQNPDSEIYMDQVKQCGSIHTNVRSISRILKSKSVFSDIKKEFGYCNGQAIVKVLEYLFYLQFEGYSILLASHQLQGKNESQIIINEYKKNLEEINQAISEELTDCSESICKGFSLKIKQIPESESEDDDQKILDIWHKTFPWYKCYIFNVKSGAKYALGDIKSESVVFVNATKTKDVVFFCINLASSKNASIRGDLDLNSYISKLSSKWSLCEHGKIGFEKDQLISHAGEKIYSSDRTADDISFYIMESRVLQCNGPSRGINECSSKPISYATSIHINTLQFAMTSVCYVIIKALFM